MNENLNMKLIETAPANTRNTRKRGETFSKLIIKTPE